MEIATGPSTLENGLPKSCVCILCRLMVKTFESFTFEEQKEIILKGRPTPALTKLTKQTKSYVRHFQTENYKKCEWLTGCDTKSLLFCWPCLLFANEKNLWNKSGFSDLNNLHKLMKQHSYSKVHIQSIITEKTFGKVTIEPDPLRISNEQHNQQVRRNREVLKRFIDGVCFLSFQHNHIETENRDNSYVDLLQLLAKYDETLKLHLENCTVFEDNIIQNDLISCIGQVAMKQIKKELEGTSFVAIIIIETIDVGNIRNLSKVVRYVTKKGEIKERFLGFLDGATQRTSDAVQNIIQSIINELDCGSKFIAQSYDGAVVTASELGELQTKIRNIYPNALFVHCMELRLNLILQQSTSSITECNVFFTTLNGMATFFAKSPKRANAFDIIALKQQLSKVTPTRWNCNAKLLVQTILEYRLSLIVFFEQILENQTDWDHETTIYSKGYLDILKTDVHFNLLLIVFSEIFPSCNQIVAVLQTKSNDIDLCIRKVKEFQLIISSKREQFDVLWHKFEQLNIEIQPPKKRARTDFIIVEDIKLYYQKLYLEIINNISTQIGARFKYLNNLKFLELIHFTDRETIPDAAFESLKQNYLEYFDLHALKSQLCVLNNTSESIINKSSISDLWTSLKECGLDQACAEIIKLCELSMTIPVTEHWFSAIKRIKNFVQNSTLQERFSNLALLSIEKDFIEEISRETTFYDDVIDEFAKRSGRMPLNFK